MFVGSYWLPKKTFLLKPHLTTQKAGRGSELRFKVMQTVKKRKPAIRSTLR